MATVPYPSVLAPSPRGAVLERFHRLLLPATIALLSYAALAQGAFYWAQAAFLAGGLLVCSVAAVTRRGAGREAGAAIVLLATGLVASAAANGWPVAARMPAATLATAAGSCVIGQALSARGERARLMEALAAIGAIVAFLGLLALPIHWFPWAMQAQKLWRTSSTLTYANAAGALFALALPASFLAMRARATRMHALETYLLLAGLGSSLSRGGAAGAAIGGVLLVTLGGRHLLRPVARPLAGAAIACVAMLPSIAGADGHPFPGYAGLVIGGLVASARLPLTRPRRAVAAFALLATAAAAAFAIGRHAEAIVVSRAGEDRMPVWRATWQEAAKHPLFGTGPGTFHAYREAYGEVFFIRYAHNEFLQIFAETGIVGETAVLAALALLARWAWRRRPGAGEADERAVWAASAAACAAFVVHGALDFTWRLPVLVAVAFCWLGIAVIRPDREGGIDS